MIGSLLDQIKTQVDKKNLDTTAAFGRSWLLQKMAKLNPGERERQDILFDKIRRREVSMIGRFYFFGYFAKTRNILPYWDRFPMVIPIEEYPDGFLGLNLHYLHPRDRLILLSQLRRFATGSLTDEQTRLRLSYPLLKSMPVLYRAIPCIKRYLSAHILTHFVEIPPEEWDVAAALPVQNYAHIEKEFVWKDSREKEYARHLRKQREGFFKKQQEQ